jgi:hypothetical protein
MSYRRTDLTMIGKPNGEGYIHGSSHRMRVSNNEGSCMSQDVGGFVAESLGCSEVHLQTYIHTVHAIVYLNRCIKNLVG